MENKWCENYKCLSLIFFFTKLNSVQWVYCINKSLRNKSQLVLAAFPMSFGWQNKKRNIFKYIYLENVWTSNRKWYVGAKSLILARLLGLSRIHKQLKIKFRMTEIIKKIDRWFWIDLRHLILCLREIR